MKIAQFTTYPTILPRHGGQIRAFHLAHFLRHQGHDVRNFVLCEPTHLQYAADDIVISKKDIARLKLPPMLADYASSQLACKKPYFDILLQQLHEFMPDVIWLEQPWLFPFVCEAYSVLPPLIYSAQNIEYQTKELMLKSMGKEDAKSIREIYKLEENLCLKADAVLACTEYDKQILKDWGAKHVVVCPNGVDLLRQKPDVEHLVTSLIGYRSFAFFVGSAYPPNAIGFWEMLSSNLAYLRSEQMIIVAGAVGRILYDYAPSKGHFTHALNMEKIKILGEISTDVLSVLLSKANVILLPLTMGGGSSLKTAEAIVANRPTVATSVAIRGFEFARGLTHFAIADSQDEFVASLQRAFTQTQPQLSKAEQDMRHSLYWGLTLEPLRDVISSLQASSSPVLKDIPST